MIGFSDNTAANDLVKDRLQTLAIKKKELESELDCVVSDEYSSVDTKEAKRIIEDRVLDFKRGWKKANPNQQKKLVRRIFNQLILTESGLQAYYSLAEDSKEIGSELKKQKPLGSNPDGLDIFAPPGSSSIGPDASKLTPSQADVTLIGNTGNLSQTPQGVIPAGVTPFDVTVVGGSSSVLSDSFQQQGLSLIHI